MQIFWIVLLGLVFWAATLQHDSAIKLAHTVLSAAKRIIP